MAGKHLKVYENEIEVIKSLEEIYLMHDEIVDFIENDKPEITSLYKLRKALQNKYEVNDDYDKILLDLKHSPFYTGQRNNIFQEVCDLINYEIHKRDSIQLSDTDTAFLFSEDFKQTNFFSPGKTFFSYIESEELIRIGNALITNKFIEVNKIEDFVFAFSQEDIALARVIHWLPTYNNKIDNVSLAILINHISPAETSKNFKQVRDKRFKLFVAKTPIPKYPRAFDTALRKVRINYYNKDNTNIKTLLTILNP